MRSTLVTILLVVPLTAVLTAGATVVALRALDQAGFAWPSATAAGRPTPVDPPGTWAPTPRTHVPAPVAPASQVPGPEALVVPDAPPVEIEVTAAPIEDTGAVTEPEVVTDNEPPAGPTVSPSALAFGAVDYQKLNNDIKGVSVALERFNSKLLRLIAGAETAPAETPEAELASPVALDQTEVRQ